MVVNIFGRKADIDVGHVAQVVVGGGILLVTWLLNQPDGLSKGVITTLTMTLMILGLVWRSIFHRPPPTNLKEVEAKDKDASTEDTLPGRRKSLFVVGLGVSLVGCATWLDNLKKDPTATLTDLLRYVSVFLEGARALWALAKPGFPAVEGARIDAQVNAAIGDVTTAQAAAEDVLHAAVAMDDSNPNFSKAIEDIKEAVAKLDAIVVDVASRAPKTGALADAFAKPSLARQVQEQAIVIREWRPR